MRTKPEGKVKKEVRRILDAYTPLVYYSMPVSNGMGKAGLDFYGCAVGRYFEIETKAYNKPLTPRQMNRAGVIEAAFGKFFQILSVEDPAMGELDHWLHSVVMEFNRRGHQWSNRRDDL